ncbi:unnamed protein product [Lactuca virosa]|uniref:Bulb-type lectin domain-containing protein n=1 Tax=Lactuca virosa TaxID=75947 RepID=A0AAU9NUX6_9ASTR|nr:unnamed protein product [Lactuca virosa]
MCVCIACQSSSSGEFAFGFQQVQGTDNFLLSIWYNKIPDRTMVWYPEEGPMVPTGSKVELLRASGLVLTDPQGTQVWRSGSISAVASGFMNDTGNFVIFGSNSRKLWGSFDFPANTLLPTQVVEIGGGMNSTIYFFSAPRRKNRSKKSDSCRIGSLSKFASLNKLDTTNLTCHSSPLPSPSSANVSHHDHHSYPSLFPNRQRSPPYTIVSTTTHHHSLVSNPYLKSDESIIFIFHLVICLEAIYTQKRVGKKDLMVMARWPCTGITYFLSHPFNFNFGFQILKISQTYDSILFEFGIPAPFHSTLLSLTIQALAVNRTTNHHHHDRPPPPAAYYSRWPQ